MLFIRNPEKGLSLAENILLMLRPKGEYTELEAKVLDIALVLTQSMAVVTIPRYNACSNIFRNRYLLFSSSFYRSLKGPRHGGANLKVQNMF